MLVCLKFKHVLNWIMNNESDKKVANWFRTSDFLWCLSVVLCGTFTFCHLSGTLCLCCGMKGSIVWKRCVWNPCCLERVRGHRVRKRTSFYSWHGSVRNATLGRRHPLLHWFSSSIFLSCFFRSLPISPQRNMATGQDSWLFGLGLVLSIACLVWNNESEDAPCDRELKRKRVVLSQLCGNKMARYQTLRFHSWHRPWWYIRSWSCLIVSEAGRLAHLCKKREAPL